MEKENTVNIALKNQKHLNKNITTYYFKKLVEFIRFEYTVDLSFF
jgi:hypothetical protein